MMAKTKAKAPTAKTRATAVVGPKNKPQETAVRPEQRNDEATAALAYALWIQRGCPFGSPDEDWFRAEEELKNCRVLVATAGVGK
jgi:hypothetical protein